MSALIVEGRTITWTLDATVTAALVRTVEAYPDRVPVTRNDNFFPASAATTTYDDFVAPLITAPSRNH